MCYCSIQRFFPSFLPLTLQSYLSILLNFIILFCIYISLNLYKLLHPVQLYITSYHKIISFSMFDSWCCSLVRYWFPCYFQTYTFLCDFILLILSHLTTKPFSDYPWSSFWIFMQEILEESISDQIIGLIIKHRGENNLMV